MAWLGEKKSLLQYNFFFSLPFRFRFGSGLIRLCNIVNEYMRERARYVQGVSERYGANGRKLFSLFNISVLECIWKESLSHHYMRAYFFCLGHTRVSDNTKNIWNLSR